MLAEIDWTAASFLMSAVAMVTSAGVGIFVRIARRHAATDDELQAMDNRVTRLEVQMQAVPTAQAWSQMREDIAGIRGDVHTSAAEIRGLGAGLKRVETQIGMLMDHELRGSGG